MSLIGVMSIIPLYYVGQKIYNEKVGMYSCLSLLFVPSVVLFTPTIDQMYMFIAITSFLLFIYGLRAGKKMRHIFFLSSGFLLSLGLFMNFGLFPMVVFNLLFYMVHTRRCKLKTRIRVPTELVFFFFGLSLLFYLIYLFYNLNIIETLLVTKKAHEIITGQRSYLIWVLFNLYDFFIFLGIPLSMLFLRKTYYIALSIKKKNIIDKNFLVFMTFLICLSLSGLIRGETGRLWMYLMPLAILFCIDDFIRSYPQRKYFYILLVLQLLQIIIFKMFVLAFRGIKITLY